MCLDESAPVVFPRLLCHPKISPAQVPLLLNCESGTWESIKFLVTEISFGAWYTLKVPIHILKNSKCIYYYQHTYIYISIYLHTFKKLTILWAGIDDKQLGIQKGKKFEDVHAPSETTCPWAHLWWYVPRRNWKVGQSWYHYLVGVWSRFARPFPNMAT